jgi:acetyltransferase-like isoleucine patch superfamily enzyme
LVETDRIGSGTRIWPFVHVLKGAEIGSDCNIGECCYIESNVKVGNEVVIKNGVSLWSGLRVDDRVFIGPNVAFTNDRIPRAKVLHEHYEETLIREGASIGANATILCGITLGSWCVVGAGSVVTHMVPEFGLVYGNPAQLHGWICKCGTRLPLPVEGDGQTRCTCGAEYILSAGQLRRQS